jgi:predicted cupin superfamily sugar epimerase
LDVERSTSDVRRWTFHVQEKMPDNLTAAEIRALLKLEPHATCGFVRVTFVSPQRIAPGGLPPPFAEGRPVGSALYFMVTPDAPVRLHRIQNDQLYHYYLGDPLRFCYCSLMGRRSMSLSVPICAVVNASSFSSRATHFTQRA